MSAAAASAASAATAASAAPAFAFAATEIHLPTLYVGLPHRDSLMPGPDVLYNGTWDALAPNEQRRFALLSDLPFTEEEVRTFTNLLHSLTLVHEDIRYIYDRINEGELSSERRGRLEETLEEHERRATELEAAMADGSHRILEALRRREEREPANWDDLPEDPVIPLVLNETQRAALALVEGVLSFNTTYAAVCAAGCGPADADADAYVGPGAGPGAGAGAGAGAGCP